MYVSSESRQNGLEDPEGRQDPGGVVNAAVCHAGARGCVDVGRESQKVGQH